jgi:hypothetical protein
MLPMQHMKQRFISPAALIVYNQLKLPKNTVSTLYGRQTAENGPLTTDDFSQTVVTHFPTSTIGKFELRD